MRFGKKAKRAALADKTNEAVDPATTKNVPPPPQKGDEETVAATPGVTGSLLSSGASMLSALGSLLSSAGPGVPPTESAAVDDVTPTPSTITARPSEPPSSLLDSVTGLLVDQAVGVCGIAVSSVKQAATHCADSMMQAVTGNGSPDATTKPARPPSPTPSVSSFSSTVSYIPPQYTATGELFSSNPSVAAMQRIPDYSCKHDLHGTNKVLHCCSLPPASASPARSMSVDSNSSLPGCASPDALSRASSFASVECSCTCFKSSSSASLPIAPTQADTPEKSPPSCDCVCHDHHRYKRGQSGHFHRIDQIVRGTKRVVRDIKNVL